MKSPAPPPITWLPAGQVATATISSSPVLGVSLSSTKPVATTVPIVTTRANEVEFTPSSRSALRFGTRACRFTRSEGNPALDWSDSAVPFGAVRVVARPAALARPSLKSPPVAAYAVPVPSTRTTSAPAVKAVRLWTDMRPPGGPVRNGHARRRHPFRAWM